MPYLCNPFPFGMWGVEELSNLLQDKKEGFETRAAQSQPLFLITVSWSQQDLNMPRP